jgi:peroxisomal 2,4-dienoyl-CoA reductase
MSRLSRKRPDGSSENGESYVPLQRLGTSLDVAHAAVFLLSPAAAFISGQVIVVDGSSEDVRPLTLPYPESVLDPEGVATMIKGKL